jgi:hypothetical protein
VVVDLDPGRSSRVANEINAKNPGRAIAVVCDVASPSSVEKMVQTVVKEFGGVDILVNNAAWTDHKTLFDITEEEWDRVMNVCLRSVWYCTRYAARAMIDQKRKGKIINIASTSGHWGRKGDGLYHGESRRAQPHALHRGALAGRNSRQLHLAGPHRFAGRPEKCRRIASLKILPPARCADGHCQGGRVLASEEADFIYAVDLPVDGALAIRD